MNDTTHLLAWLRLARSSGIGGRSATAALRRFGDPAAVFEASERELAGLPGFGRERARALLDPAVEEAAAAEFELARAEGIHLIVIDAAEYPAALRRLPQPPLVLAVRGELRAEDRLAVSVVGPRQPSDYARAMTRGLVPPLCARGITIVSGLAYGVDAEAHAAALACGGRTVGVLGQGLLTPLYPASNRDLLERIVREGRGAAISTFALEAKPQAGHYPRRNEVIAALGLGTLVVEAGERSGSLITARRAGELGATVMACPGDATRPNARGSNALIADGAMLVQNSDDVLEALGGELRRALREVELERGEATAQRDERALEARRFESVDEWLKALGLLKHEHAEGEAEEAPDGELPLRFGEGGVAGIARKPGRKRAVGRRGNGAAEAGEAEEFDETEERDELMPADPMARLLLEQLRDEHRPLDYLLGRAAEQGYGQPQIVQALLEMEMAGMVERLPGRVYRRRV